MDQPTLEALLCRPLRDCEVNNLTTYLEIAEQQLEQVVCWKAGENFNGQICLDEATSEITLPLFVKVTDFSQDDQVIPDTEYSRAVSGTDQVYTFNQPLTGTVFVTGAWGFKAAEMPADYQMLLGRTFELIGKQYCTQVVESKSNEGFSVSYETKKSAQQLFVNQFAATIGKYSICQSGVSHGAVRCIY